MPDPLTSLPGDILGLLRRGSPVLWRDEETPYIAAWVGPWPDADIEDGAIVQAAPSGYGLICIEDRAGSFALDLTDATGRAHAAWWANERAQTHLWPTDPRGEDEAVMLAMLGQPMTPTQIDTLARLVLRLAGR